jgi:hypothetical protein
MELNLNIYRIDVDYGVLKEIKIKYHFLWMEKRRY